jgi:hypothetical protein
MRLSTILEVHRQICGRAGVASAMVEIIDHSQDPPRLVHLPMRRRPAPGVTRKVVVGREWLRTEAPELAAALIAVRLEERR